MLRDFRYAFRNLRRTPLFTTVALLSLALGIGANSAVFTIADQVLLRDLPGSYAGALLYFTSPGAESRFSYPMFQDFRDRSSVFAAVAARYPAPVNLTYNNRTDRIQAELVSGTWFETLGLAAAAGRPLTPDDDRVPGGHSVVVLAYDFWRSRFGGDRAILNQVVLLNGHPMTVVGVAGRGYRGFDLGMRTDVLVPTMMKGAMTPAWNGLDDRRLSWLQIVARLKPGISVDQAEARLQPFYRALVELELEPRQVATEGAPLRLVPASHGVSDLRNQLAAPVWVLLAAAVLLLLIACANMANLLLARAAGRQREMAIRVAAGAARSRLVVQLLAESMALASGAAALALLVASWTVGGVMGLIASAPEMGLTSAFDYRVFVFTFGLGVLTGAAFGIAPAWQASSPSLAQALRRRPGNEPPARSIAIRKGLVISQVAIAFLMLDAAALCTRSLRNLSRADRGSGLESLARFALDPSLSGYSAERIRRFLETLEERLTTVRGIQSAAAGLDGALEARAIRIERYRPPPAVDMSPYVNAVGPGWFATLGIPLLAGREFTARDGPRAPRVAVVSETFARDYFGSDAIGKRFAFRGEEASIEIAGVVRNPRRRPFDEAPSRVVFLPLSQTAGPGALVVYVRTAGDARAWFPAIRREVAQIDGALPVTGLRTMAGQLADALAPQRLIAVLTSLFAALATMLAAIGVYGLVAYSVSRRTREIGIRVALGATRDSVLRTVMREVEMLTGAGIAVAVPFAVALHSLVRAQLYRVAAFDPLSIGAAVAALAVAVLAAGYAPAVWASRENPSAALRE